MSRKVLTPEQIRDLARIRISNLIQLTAKYGKVCWYCGEKFNSFSQIEIDHIVPKCRGGSSKLSNLAIACKHCNRGKWDLTLQEFLHWLKKPKISVPLLVERAQFTESQFSSYAEEIDKGLRKPTKRTKKTAMGRHVRIKSP